MRLSPWPLPRGCVEDYYLVDAQGDDTSLRTSRVNLSEAWPVMRSISTVLSPTTAGNATAVYLAADPSANSARIALCLLIL